MGKKESFYKALRDVFIGAKVDGKGGFINLMRIKAKYYRQIEPLLNNDIREALKNHSGFEEELFDKLHNFFKRYFTQNGSIYFNDTAFHNNVYEKIYTNEKDVALFWKTRMLYYVKTESLYQSMPVEFDGLRFYFDCSNLKNKSANEKRRLIFEFSKISEDGMINLLVKEAEKGSVTNLDKIIKSLKKQKVDLSEEQLERSFRVFGKQNEVDFFINKNAESFLKEQFKLWAYQYFWEGAPEWEAKRVNELQILKNIAFKIIDFIAQFESELLKIWQKPKFVKNSNYVISLDRVSSKLVKKIKSAPGYQKQQEEWRTLGITADNPKAPIDTKFFKELELEIIGQFDNLDEALDGWLIKSENYQALNTILPKFKEKVQTIYIDPPFNTGNDFVYEDKFQNSTWLSFMDNRIRIAKDLLIPEGSFYMHLDQRMAHKSKIILDECFGSGNFINEIIWNYEGTSNSKKMFARKHDNIFLYSKTEDYIFNTDDVRIKFKDSTKYKKDENGRMYKPWSEDIPKYYPPQEYKNGEYKLLGKTCYDVFNDVPSASTSHGKEFDLKYNTQKPEKLLHRIIMASSEPRGLVIDFFSGSGTSLSVAQKSYRRWIGIEINTKGISAMMKRMKEVLMGMEKGISGSKEVSYKGGGFFKYYELEQYEEALANCRYKDDDLFHSPNKSAYEQYVFMNDEKMLKAIELDAKKNKVNVDLSKLYDNIDIAETLSNLTGKAIKTIKADEVEFSDGDKIKTDNLSRALVKPLIWW